MKKKDISILKLLEPPEVKNLGGFFTIKVEVPCIVARWSEIGKVQ